MQEGLRLLSELTDDDICWLQGVRDTRSRASCRHGADPRRRTSRRYFCRARRPSRGIEVEAITNQRIALRGPGHLLGEVSFLDGQAASATVKSVENTLLLVLPRTTLEARLLTDAAFAARFYRACALVAARRLREQPAAGEPQQMGRRHHRRAGLRGSGSASQGRWRP